MKIMLPAWIAAGMIGIAGRAVGQEAPSPANPSAAAAPRALEQVIVTATRRRENLQHTAIAVTNVSSAQLEAAGVVQARDLSKTVAGLSITANGPGAQVYLRGVGTFATNTYSSSPVALNLDGIYLGLPGFSSGIFYDVARVEVLKGPQGTLYGKNATAGAVNVITNPPVPGPRPSGELSFEVGAYALFRTAAALNLPVAKTLSLRLAAEAFSRDGYYSDHTGRTGGQSARLTALYRPNDDLSVTLAADYQHQTGEEEPLVVIGANPSNPWEGPTTARSNADIVAARSPADRAGVGLPPFFSSLLPTITSADLGLRNDNAGGRGDLEDKLGWTDLSVLSSYRHLTTYWVTDPGFANRQTARGDQETVEARLASPADARALKWQGGLYYYHNASDQGTVVGQGFLQPTLRYRDTDRSAAAFGEATLTVLPHVRVTAGLRATTETLTQSGSGTDAYTPAAQASFGGYLTASGVPAAAVPGLVATDLAPIAFSVSNRATFRNLSVKGGAEYDWTPDALLYANFTSGFKSGGINPDLSTASQSNVFRPETLEAYTVGSKNRLLAGRLTANGEAFWWDYKNHQEIYLTQSQADPSVSLPLTHNIGAATVKGLSADITARATASDVVGAQVEYLDAVFDRFDYDEYTAAGYTPDTGCAKSFVRAATVAGQSESVYRVSCDGKPFTRAPHWTLNLSLQHSFDLGDRGSLTALVNSHITTAQWLAVDYVPLEHEGGLTVTDLNLTYAPLGGRWSVTFYVRNMENTASYSAAFAYAFASNVVFGAINPPRTYGGIVRVKF